MQGANLQGAYLQDAYLQGANLQGANLRDANLQGAYLQGAEGINKYLITPLLILKEQTGKIRAYKLVTAEYEGPQFRGIEYKIGEVIERNADTNEQTQCSYGISLATLDWCIKEWRKGYHVLVCEFTNKDIAAIPTATDGKFRVHRCKVIKEIDYKKIGLEV